MSMTAQSAHQNAFSLSDRLTIIQELIQQLGPQNTLRVVVNDDPMISHQSNLVGNLSDLPVRKRGSKSLRKTQNNNLLQKLQVMQKKQLQHPKPLPTKSTIDTSTLTVYEQPQVQQPQQRTMYRYFTQGTKCFRCKKMGHYDYACLDEFSCSYCLSSEHHSERCPQKVVCFRCYDFGHMVNQCPLKQDGPYCHNCKRKHFDKCAFLMKGVEQVKQMFIMDSLYNHDQIRCLKCYKYGHFNCQTTEGTYYKRPYVNSSDRNDKKQSRDKYDNNRDKHDSNRDKYESREKYDNQNKRHKY